MSGAGNTKVPVKGWTAAVPEAASRPVALGDVLVETHDLMAKRSGVALGHEAWRSIVGERIAARSRVASLSKGLLTIRVASTAWGTELSFLSVDLLRRFAEVGLDVQRLRFLVDAEMSGQAPRAARSGSRALRREGTESSVISTAPPGPTELPPELLAKLAAIEDPVLRASIAEAARHTLLPKRRAPDEPTRASENGRHSGQERPLPRDTRR